MCGSAVLALSNRHGCCARSVHANSAGWTDVHTVSALARTREVNARRGVGVWVGITRCGCREPPCGAVAEFCLQRSELIAQHYDAQVMWDPLLAPSGPAGVTTVVTGNCGVGLAPTRPTPEDREYMISTLGAIEDIPSEVLRQASGNPCTGVSLPFVPSRRDWPVGWS